MRSQNFSVVFFNSLRSYINFALLGICTGCIGAFVNICISNLAHLKNHYLAKLIEDCEKGSCIYEIYITWILSVWIFIFIGTFIAVFIEPGVTGGGVGGVVAYLNGVDVPNCLTGSVVFFKTICLICTMSSGMVAGKEGPMIHIGAALGAVIVLIPGVCFLCGPFRNDTEMRDLVAAGVAGGVSAAFGAPVGGFLLSIEESVSFLSIRLMFKIFLCALFSVTSMNFIASAYNGFPGDIQRDNLLYLGKVEAELTDYSIYEVPAFLFMGIIAGLVGALYVFVQETMHVFRRKYVVKKWMKMMEGVVVVFTTVTTHMLATYLLEECSETEEPGNNVKMHCKKGIKEISMYTLNTGEECLRWLVQSPIDRISLKTSVAMFLIYFGLGMYSLGISMAIGLFVPNLIIGASWGRGVAILLNRMFPKNKWANAKKYTFLAAAAQLSGSLRLTFSITVIAMEITGNIHMVLPLMVTLVVAKWVGDLFTPPMFDAQILLSGMPYMIEHPPPFSEEIPVTYIMSQPTRNFPPVISVDEALSTFQTYSFQGYPVVDSSNMLIGFVLESQVLILIKSKMFVGKDVDLDALDKLFNRMFRKKIDINELKLTNEERRERINLKIIMNPCPYAVRENMSFARAYNLFRHVGLRHLMIVNSSYKVVGIITRKDLAKYHVVQNGIARLPVI